MIDPPKTVSWQGFTPLLLLVFLYLFVKPAYSQQGENLVTLDHADRLVGTQINGEEVKQLIGHVQFHQGKTVVTCDTAIQFLASNRIALEGVVEVRDDSLRMVGRRGMYYSDTKIAEAFERVLLEDRTTILHSGYGKYYSKEKKAYFKTHVYVEDTSSVLTSDELTYFRTDERSIAVGNVTIVSKSNGLTITGNRFENFKQQKYSKMTEGPKLTQVDTTSDGMRDTLVVTSSLMESYQDSLERLIATNHVQITRTGLAAEAGASIFYTKLDSIILRQSPVIWYSQGNSGDNQVSGDSVFLKLKQRKLETAYVRGRAFAISRTDSSFPHRFNQMTGQEIILRFSNNAMKQIDVVTTATSMYYLFDGNKGNGMNKTTGDHIIITFHEGKIDNITAITGVEGQYVPERLIKGREREYNLQGFNYRENRPGKGK